jgi:diaminopimelate epimerase
MNIEFIKMQGAGNDYIYLDLVKNSYDVDRPDLDRPDLDRQDFDWKNLAQAASSRHFGVGGDGLVLIMPSGRADYRMRMFNSDGSEAEMCGNAILCVGKYLHDSGYLNKEELAIETLGGIKHLWIVEKDGHGKALRLKVDMGEPVLRGKDIPIAVDMEPVTGIEVKGYSGTAVSMGNPHFVIFVDDITDKHVLTDGPKLEVDPIFPKKANIEFIQVTGRQSMTMRVWERGSGETLACGTGACASAVAGILNNLTDRKVDVKLLGGTLKIEWNEENNHVYMTGPAVEVFRGVYHYQS